WACANTDRPACDSTWLRDICDVSLATSTSRMREFAADRFKRMVWMLLCATSRRFIAAPNEERDVDTLEIAVSMVESDESAPAAVEPESATPAPEMVGRDTAPSGTRIWSELTASSPTCSEMVLAVAPRSCLPLNL